MKFVLVPAVQKLTKILFGGLTLNEVSHWLMNASVWALLGIGTPLVLFLLWLSVRYIPHNRVGVIEKLWSGKGSLGVVAGRSRKVYYPPMTTAPPVTRALPAVKVLSWRAA